MRLFIALILVVLVSFAVAGWRRRGARAGYLQEAPYTPPSPTGGENRNGS